MPTGWILEEIAPDKLRNHPCNIEVYGTAPIDPDMLESIRKHGVIEPCRCTHDGVLLSGHRRRQCAVAAKLKAIPVLRARHEIGADEQIIEIVESNRQREKTNEQKAREFKRLTAALEKIAEKRMKTGRRIPRANLPYHQDGESEIGRAKDQAAERVGMSRRSAEAAEAVVDKVDSLKAEGKPEEAEKLIETLNTKSVRAAAIEAGIEQSKTASDKFGPVHKRLAHIFDDVAKFAGIVSRIGRLRAEIEELQRADSGAAIPINDCLDNLKALQSAIKFATPFCECPKCRRSKKECDACEGLRWITEPTFKRCRTPDDEKWLAGDRS